MLRALFRTAAIVALLAPGLASAQGSNTVIPLLVNATATGNLFAGTLGGNYQINLAGTVGGSTVTVTASDSSGVQQTVATFSAVGTQCIALPARANLQAVVAGGTPSGLYLNASGVQYCPTTSGGAATHVITDTGSVTALNAAIPAGSNVIGHVIVDTTSTTTVTQATAANLNATVVGTGTFAVQNTAATPAGSSIIGKVGIDQTTPGTTNGVQVNAALPAGTNVIGHVITDAGSVVGVSALTSGGATPFHVLSAASNNATLVSTGAHTLYSLVIVGTNATIGDVRIYDSAGSPTCSSATGVIWNFPVIATTGALGGLAVPIPAQGQALVNGLAYCITGAVADNDNTNAPTGITVNGSYK